MKVTRRNNSSKIKEIESEIYSEEAIIGLNAFTANVKGIAKLARKIEAVRKPKSEYYTKRDLAQMLDLKLNDTAFFDFDEAQAHQILYTLKLMEEKGIARPFSKQTMSYGGGKLRCTWKSDQVIFIFEEKIVMRIQPYIVETKGLKFLVLYQESANYQIPDNYLIVCDDSKSEEIIDFFSAEVRENTILKKGIVILNSKGVRVEKLNPKLDLKQVVLEDSIKQECNLLVRMFKNFKEYEKNKIPFKRNVLLYSNPGMGKTSAIRAIAGEVLKAKGIVISLEITDKYGSQGKLSSAYELAQKNAPALLIVEDFDLLAGSRDSGAGGESTTSELLQLLDGVKQNNGVVCLFSTNRLKTLDRAAVRAGRIDRGYLVSYPNREMKEEIVKSHLKLHKIKLPFKKVLKAMDMLLSHKTTTGAEIDSAISGAMQMSVAHMEKLKLDHIKWASETFNRLEYTESTVGGFSK